MTSTPAFALPRRPLAADGLTPAQWRAVVAVIAALHGVAVWGLLQVREVREAVAQAAPMFVDLIATEAPKPVPPVPPAPPPPRPQPPVKQPPPPAPLITAAPTPSPAPPAMVAPPPPPQPALLAEPAPAVVAAPAPPAPAPAPKVLPSSAVQYLIAPQPVYPPTSRRMAEQGRVLLRVFIDEAGLPQSVTVARSSGFARLDDAGLAAVQKARFKPPTQNGQPLSGWAQIPIDFELE